MNFKTKFKVDYKARWNQIVSMVKQISIEPFLFFLMFGFYVRVVSLQSMLIDRACRLELNYGDDVCDHLKKHKAEKESSMAFGNNLYTGALMMGTVPGLVVSTFLGPWSDIYGRKYALYISTIGLLTSSVMECVLTSLKYTSPFYFMLSALFAGLGGGLIVSLSCVYSYMSHVTDEKSRPTRFAVLEFFFIMASPLGTIIGGEVYAAGGYLSVMAVGSASFCCAFLWLVFMVKETAKRREGVTRKEAMRDLFRYDNLVQSYRTATTPRAGNLRLQIWLLILVSALSRMINVGAHSLGFPYVRAVFHWDVTEYSHASTVFYFLHALMTVTIVPAFNLKFFIHEAAVGLIGAFSLMAKLIVYSVAVKPALIYYAMFCGLLTSCEGIAIRSRMSKLVGKGELGRIFSLIATCEAFSPVIGTALFTQIFNASLWYPGLTFAVAACTVVPIVVVFMWMMRLPTTSYGSYRESEVSDMKELQEVTRNG